MTEKRKAKYTKGGIEYRVLPGSEHIGVEFDDSYLQKLDKLVEQAEEHFAGNRVEFEWLPRHIAMLQEIASALNVPVDAYVKQALFERMTDDYARLTIKARARQAGHSGELPTVAEPRAEYDSSRKAKSKRRKKKAK
jgi:hypothetical protein